MQPAILDLPTALGGNGGRFGCGRPQFHPRPRIIQLAARIYF